MNEKTKKRYKMEFEMLLNSGLKFEEYLKQKCKHKHDISKIKNAIIHSSFPKNTKDKYIKLAEEANQIKPKFKKKPEETLNLRKTLNMINLLKSKRLKLSYRFQLISGLRLEELSSLTAQDITFKNNKIFVHVNHGKGDKSRKIECLKDNYVYDNLIELVPKKNGKLFCSYDYLMKIAKKTGFHTHDLRKSFAQSVFYNDDGDNKTSIRNLQDKLGHEHNTSTYKKYLNRSINLNNTKFDLNKQKIRSSKEEN